MCTGEIYFVCKDLGQWPMSRLGGMAYKWVGDEGQTIEDFYCGDNSREEEA